MADSVFGRRAMAASSGRAIADLGLEDVEYATLEYVDWFNNGRITSGPGYSSPLEHEQWYYDQERVAAVPACV